MIRHNAYTSGVGFQRPIMRFSAAILGLACMLALSACDDERRKRVAFDGVYFKAKTKSVDKKRSLADFVTTIDGVSYSLNGAREAGRYEGTKYCIANYGTSTIDWKVGPDTDPSRLVVVDDTLTFQGKCDP